MPGKELDWRGYAVKKDESFDFELIKFGAYNIATRSLTLQRAEEADRLRCRHRDRGVRYVNGLSIIR